jgi:fatty-acyl-CoA synthase
MVKRAVEAYPERTAFRTDAGDLTYRVLGERISQVVAAFKRAGIGRGDAVAILSPNRTEYFMVTVACALTGVRYTPLHPLGSADDHRLILTDAGITTLIADAAAFGERGRDLRQTVPSLKRLLSFDPLDGAEDLIAAASREAPAPLVDEAEPGDIVAIAYTGGTTGLPKGVVLTHSAIAALNWVAIHQWQWPEQIVALLTTPVSHAAGGIIMPVLSRGGTVILHPGFEATKLLRTLETERANVLFLVPTMIYMLLDKLREAPFDVSSLELVIYGAAPMAPDRLAEALERIGPVFMQIYGQVEASATICALLKEDHQDRSLLTSCGRPLLGHDVRLFDTDGREVGDDEPGEICIRSAALMREYWNRPAETAAAFRDGWLRTGDIARRDARGYLHIIDRAKDMIISGGFNVYPREIEDVLMTHPDVARAAVIGVPDPKWGEAVDAYVVARPGAAADAATLVELVRSRKGPLHAPKRITFVDALPLTPIGKVDKKALRARFWGGRERQVS